MENASKAIIIAGGILIALIIISLLVLLFSQIGNVYSEQDKAISEKQLAEYNRKFAVYDNNKGLYGSELLSLANLTTDYNKKLLDSVNGNLDDNFYKDNEIKITVTIYNITGSELLDDKGNPIKNSSGKILKEYTKGQVKGTYNISELQAFNQQLVDISESSKEAKSAITEFRSLPYKCNISSTKYNKFGRITFMHFEQVVENFKDFK